MNTFRERMVLATIKGIGNLLAVCVLLLVTNPTGHLSQKKHQDHERMKHYFEMETERQRSIQASRCRLPLDTTWEDMGELCEQNRLKLAEELGLPPDSSWSEVYEAEHIEQARALGLPDHATLLDIMVERDHRLQVMLKALCSSNPDHTTYIDLTGPDSEAKRRQLSRDLGFSYDQSWGWLNMYFNPECGY